MPDCFIDRFIRVGDLNQFIRTLRSKASKGGGSIRGFTQLEAKGGNAINLAYALAKLDIPTTAIVMASGSEEAFLNHQTKDLKNLDIKYVQGRAGLTVALELSGRNVMVSDAGDLPSFNPRMINQEHWAEIAESAWVAVVNWAVLQDHGTELMSEVLSFAREHGVSTFTDPSDLTGRKGDLPALIEEVFSKRLVDVFSLNEQEAKVVAKHLGIEGPMQDVALRLSAHLNCTIDLHTASGSYSAANGKVTFSRSFKVRPRYLTGAGDVWNAGDILGYLLKLDAGRRLTLANAAASIFLESERAEAPTFSQVQAFLRDRDPTVALL